MRFRLVVTRDRGRRLSRAEIEAAEPVVGELLLRDRPSTSSSFRRTIRYADLVDRSIPSAPRSLRPPLFGPQLIRVTEQSMLLVGYEIDSDGSSDAIYDYAQGWLLRPA